MSFLNQLFKFKRPKGIYTRFILIIILPMLILQTVIATVFMERYWQTVTQRLSMGTTRDIAMLVGLIEKDPDNINLNQIIQLARQKLKLIISLEPGTTLPPPRSKHFFSILDNILAKEIKQQINRPFWINTSFLPDFVEIRIKLDSHILRILTHRNQTYASNTHIFILWMVGTSIILITISILFLRGQIRPILSLAVAAESFGKGQTSYDFHPSGAKEIRRAGQAFLLMRKRIERQIEQRTAMLTGVSHDLRTILTRFKLQIALVENQDELKGLNEDINDMQSMLEAYLAFARGESEEDTGTVNIIRLFEKIEEDFECQNKPLTWNLKGNPEVHVRPNAFSRLIFNLASNAQCYAHKLVINAHHDKKWLTITFDDDGPGIPEHALQDVFKPFFRLDSARNLNKSGTGLGLTIVQDISRSHGGNVILEKSPLGGLRVRVSLPV
ncbi:Osmolarity sensor protein EnvZ [Liberibacter crescens BT-1]|uniref:histidine kinase n=1 Tax=Liberibacter crescens (strain BT-1) TaxID=1215343 RepID=L0EVD2_LIBCB|nr:ATP-binding protein [Liberibacter crescens]AGA64815.1 Osmolarity sensor protein EnvZ [Liberibacter crescens BT-1]